MKFLLDTSVLVAAILESHPAHEQALPWLHRAKQKIDQSFVAAHSIAELYAILTRLPIKPRITPIVAQQLIENNVLATSEVVSLDRNDYANVIKRLSGLGIIGGVTYDALILYAAAKADVDQIVTLNEKDFRRIFPELAHKIVSP